MVPDSDHQLSAGLVCAGVIGVAGLLACCEGGRPTIHVIQPLELADAVEVSRSDAVLAVSPSWTFQTNRVRLLAPDTFVRHADVDGRLVWVGRDSWQQTVVSVEEPDGLGLLLVRADKSDSLVLTPPAPSGWRPRLEECGASLCSFTWRDEGGSQFVDVVDMASLTKLNSYPRQVPATLGVADPARDVIYHVDSGYRVVAEDQRTGRLLWTQPVDPPTRRREGDPQVPDILVSGRGRYVLAIQSDSYRGEHLMPELSLVDAKSGERLLIDQTRFAALTDDVCWIDVVPGTDDIVITSMRSEGASLGGSWENHDRRLLGLEQVSLPLLTTVAKRPVTERDPLSAPAQVVPLASGRVLFVGR